MNYSRWFLLLATALLVAGCAPKKIATPPAPAAPPPPAPQPKPSIVVLLQDPDGATGRIFVRNAGGTAQLERRNTAVTIARADSAPSSPAPIGEGEIKRRFGSVLSALPPTELRFTLHSPENSDELVPASTALLPAIAKAIQERRSTYVSVTGHTSTTGTSEVNFKLGLRRAERVAADLRAAGVAASVLFVSSHGEADLLIPTPDEFPESKNRRVEIVIR